jgi:hypothetical protein
VIKSLLSRMAFRTLLGLYVGDREVTLSRVVVTPLGPHEVECQTVAYQPEQLGEVLANLLVTPGRRRSRRPLLVVGLPAIHVFLNSRPLKATQRDASAMSLIQEALRSSNINVDEIQVDMIRSQPGKSPLANLISCRKKYLTWVLSQVEQSKVRPWRVEPAPLAMLRLGEFRHRKPSKARAVVRVFLGGDQAVALLVVAGVPLAWRTFELPAGSEPNAVSSAVMSLQVVGRFCGESQPLDAVLIHGRPDLSEPLASEMSQSSLKIKPSLYPDPPYDDRSLAMGMALGCRLGEEAFDLGRALKTRAPLREVIPWGMFVAQAVVLAWLTFLLNGQCSAVRDSFHAIHEEGARHAWMDKVTDENLEKEKKDLEQRITAIREYLDTRILWSSFTRDAAARLPESIFLRSFAGVCELEVGSKKSAKKSMMLKLSAPIPKGEAMPREIDQYLTALRGDAVLQKDFGMVELADLTWSQGKPGSTTALAEFTINCLPKVDKPGPKAPPGEAKAEH